MPSRPLRARSPQTAKKIGELKMEAGKLFVGKDYGKAVDAYDRAIKLLPDSTDKADLFSNKAACFYQQKKCAARPGRSRGRPCCGCEGLPGIAAWHRGRTAPRRLIRPPPWAARRFKEAVKECTSALSIAPSLSKALRSRAKALEQLGLYKQALADVQALNRGDAANDESREAERRLKDTMSGRRSGSGAAASATNGAAPLQRAAGRAAGRSNPPYTFAAKCTFGNETRLVHMSHNVSYADLYAAVQDKFPGAGPVALKYLDREGDLVTITSRWAGGPVGLCCWSCWGCWAGWAAGRLGLGLACWGCWAAGPAGPAGQWVAGGRCAGRPPAGGAGAGC
jgi:tetratricopeptide (TPR) repeat protein